MRTFVFIAVVAVSMAFAGDWGQWRGPDFNSVSSETNLPAALNPETLLWSTPMPGPGEATPVVCGDRVYIAGYRKKLKSMYAQCLNAATGKQLWYNGVAEFDKQSSGNSTPAAPSPVADATGCVFLYSDGTLVKYDPDGIRLWKRSLEDDYGRLSVKFGYSSSPLSYNGRLYLSVLRYPEDKDLTGLNSYLLCADAATGETVFKVDRPTDAYDESTNAYTTPVPATVNGQPQIIVYGGDYLTSHDPTDGRQLWRHLYSTSREHMDRLIPTPTVGDGRLFCSYPRGTKTFAVDLDKAAAGQPPLLWTYDQPGPDVSCPLLYAGSLYVINDKQKSLTCLDPATGQARWTGQLDKSSQYYASITAGDGKLYMVNRKGTVTVVAANPNAFEIISTHDFGQNPVDSSISIANGKLYLRTPETLYCFGQK